jgi:ribosomal protein S18 acetylase RimI-like enzyme
MSILIREIRKRGETPFLHVKGDNVGAIRLYESLGFRFRISFRLALVKNTGGNRRVARWHFST